MSQTAVLDYPETTPGKRITNPKGNPSGISLTECNLKEFLTKPFEEQRKDVDQRWLELAYTLPTKAVHFALRATKKEFGALQQLVTAAAIAKDKRFPSSDESLTIRIPARMLNSYSCAIILKPTENAKSIIHDTPTEK